MHAQAIEYGHQQQVFASPLAAGHMQVLGARKPNLVVIDEIDGATGGAEGHSAIAALIKIITAGTKQQPGE